MAVQEKSRGRIFANRIDGPFLTVVTVQFGVGSFSTVSSAADPQLVNGQVIGVTPSGGQGGTAPGWPRSVILQADGSVTVTLYAATSAQPAYQVSVLRR